MPHVDPIVRFWIGVVVTIAITISQGAISLTHAIPESAIAATTAWAGIIAVIGSAILTTLNGAGALPSSRIASAAALAGVSKIEVTPALTSQTDQEKVVLIGAPTAVEAAAAVAAPPAAAIAAPPAAEIAVEKVLEERKL
jgi:hypothetical protein